MGLPVQERQSILIVDDDQDLVETLFSMLTSNGFRVLSANSAPEAAPKLRNQKFTCVLVDIRLERGNGEDIIASMRKDKTSLNFETPVIVISGFLDQELIMRIGQHVNSVLVKPFENQALLAKIKEAIVSPKIRMHKK